MSNIEIKMWINNDEGLYNWFHEWKRSAPAGRRRIDDFITQNRQELLLAIGNVMHGRKPAHYLAYGG